MNKKLKAAWIRALRSGKYKKAKGQLCIDGKSHCCLGVLYEVATKKKIPIDMWPMGLLPTAMSDALSIGALQEDLATRNDGRIHEKHAWSFKRIAAWIEKNVPVAP